MQLGPVKVWDRFVITNRQAGDTSPYITRLRIVDTPWFGVFVHTMHRPDAQPMLHDHPWPFVSFVLRGGYTERILDPVTRQVRERHIRRFNRKRMIDAHYIVALDQRPTRTLMFVGRTRRKWGYWEQVLGSSTWTWTAWDEHWVSIVP